MYDRFKGKDRKIVVGVSFDDQTDALVKTALGFHEKTGIGIRLVNVVENDYVIGTSHLAMNAGDILAKIDYQHLQQAKDRLRQFAKNLPVEAETNTVFGNPGLILAADAAAAGASLILCGSKMGLRKYLPKGFSTALTTACRAAVPTLILPEKSTFDPSSHLEEIFFGDDLSDHSMDGLHTAIELALTFKVKKLRHIHVHPRTLFDVKQWGRKIEDAAQSGPGGVKIDLTLEKIMEHLEKDMREKIQQRVGAAEMLLTAQGTQYVAESDYGDPADVLSKKLDDNRPDLAVFGRHEIIHSKPFGLGRVPFHTILSHEIATVIVPQVKRLL